MYVSQQELNGILSIISAISFYFQREIHVWKVMRSVRSEKFSLGKCNISVWKYNARLLFARV